MKGKASVSINRLKAVGFAEAAFWGRAAWFGGGGFVGGVSLGGQSGHQSDRPSRATAGCHHGLPAPCAWISIPSQLQPVPFWTSRAPSSTATSSWPCVDTAELLRGEQGTENTRKTCSCPVCSSTAYPPVLLWPPGSREGMAASMQDPSQRWLQCLPPFPVAIGTDEGL